MTRPVSRTSIVWSIIKKDLKDYSRDRLWMFLTVLTLVFMIAIFWVLPDSVDESIPVGISGLGDPAVLAGLETTEEEGLRLVPFGSAAALQSVVWLAHPHRAANPASSSVLRATTVCRVGVGVTSKKRPT